MRQKTDRFMARKKTPRRAPVLYFECKYIIYIYCVALYDALQ